MIEKITVRFSARKSWLYYPILAAMYVGVTLRMSIDRAASIMAAYGYRYDLAKS